MDLQTLFAHNRRWASRMLEGDPEFFSRLANLQAPRLMWIGCSDSRVPANQICGLEPGEVFVHRNVANLVIHSDLNCLSVMQYAIDVLQVEDVIICGHYGCGGVQAALQDLSLGLIDNWLRHLQDVSEAHAARLIRVAPRQRWELLCALNVIEQARNAAQTTIVREAWKRGQKVRVHGWIYDVNDGLLRDLQCTMSSVTEVVAQHQAAVAKLRLGAPREVLASGSGGSQG